MKNMLPGKKILSGNHFMNTGTELWLDTGDMEEAEANWSAEMSALTTNNTCLTMRYRKEFMIFLSPKLKVL